jgi:hypothetical protein
MQTSVYQRRLPTGKEDKLLWWTTALIAASERDEALAAGAVA